MLIEGTECYSPNQNEHQNHPNEFESRMRLYKFSSLQYIRKTHESTVHWLISKQIDLRLECHSA